jgi:hypothetical protein
LDPAVEVEPHEDDARGVEVGLRALLGIGKLTLRALDVAQAGDRDRQQEERGECRAADDEQPCDVEAQGRLLTSPAWSACRYVVSVSVA